MATSHSDPGKKSCRSPGRRHTCTRRIVIPGSVIIILAIASLTKSAEPELKVIMQALRDDVVEITDGLLTDDFDKVAAGAARIADHPRIAAAQIQLVAAELGPEMAAFKQFDNSVHDSSLSVAAAAELLDRDRAIAGFQGMLSACLACHAAYKDRVRAALAGAAEP